MDTKCIQDVHRTDTQVRLGKVRLESGYRDIVEYLNEKADTKYRHTSKKTQDLIKARYNEGFTEDDFKKVIDIKADEWLNTDMSKFLRPETLFSNKFEGYLNQKPKGDKPSGTYQNARTGATTQTDYTAYD